MVLRETLARRSEFRDCSIRLRHYYYRMAAADPHPDEAMSMDNPYPSSSQAGTTDTSFSNVEDSSLDEDLFCPLERSSLAPSS